jgi:sucrose phosphatase-like protein
LPEEIGNLPLFDHPSRYSRSVSAKRLLATDLDGTFIGDDQAMYRLWEQLDREGIVLAFSTGRHLASIEAFYAEHDAERKADACLCMVGTEIYLLDSDGYRLDDGWRDHIQVGWDKQIVDRIMEEIPEARLQPAEWQSPFKNSYFLEENVAARLDEIHERLEAAVLRAKVVYSAGRFLDLLPIRSGKGGAVRYLADELGLSPSAVVTSGDTGNDLDMMRPDLGFRCIAVGNAAPELAEYREPHVYHAETAYAAGIREGLEHYGWLQPIDGNM